MNAYKNTTMKNKEDLSWFNLDWIMNSIVIFNVSNWKKKKDKNGVNNSNTITKKEQIMIVILMMMKKLWMKQIIIYLIFIHLKNFISFIPKILHQESHMKLIKTCLGLIHITQISKTNIKKDALL